MQLSPDDRLPRNNNIYHPSLTINNDIFEYIENSLQIDVRIYWPILCIKWPTLPKSGRGNLNLTGVDGHDCQVK